MKKNTEISAPQSLGSLFAEESDSDQEFEQVFEEQTISICGKDIVIRQFCWHQANANKVWPGTFNLAAFISKHEDHFTKGKIIELGAATGALSIFLLKQSGEYDIITSDIDDGGDVEENCLFNFKRNDLKPVLHVPFTWGTPWPTTSTNPEDYTYVIASDILLYVSAYPALVASLEYLFAAGVVEFVMSWNRRIDASASFFQQMVAAGFNVHHHGECVYSFYRDVTPPYLAETIAAAVLYAGEDGCKKVLNGSKLLEKVVHAETETETEIETDVETETETKTDVEIEVHVETETETETEIEIEIEIETEIEDIDYDGIMAAAVAAEEELVALSLEDRVRLEAELAIEQAAAEECKNEQQEEKNQKEKKKGVKM